MDLQQLTDKVLQLEISKDFFLSSIAMQTGLFSTIVIVTGLFIYFQYKNKIKQEIDKRMKKLVSTVQGEISEKFDKFKNELLYF